MKFLIILTFLVSAFAWSTPQQVEKLLSKSQRITGSADRLEYFSRYFLGKPYGKGGPLGEGPEGRYDQDPLYRFDTFDCTTYVETIMALALTHSVYEFESKINEIRYENSEVDYLKRNHFTDLQWIPANVENGLLSEINHEIAEDHQLLTASAIVNYPGWLKKTKIEQIQVPYATPTERQILLDELMAHAQFYSPQEAIITYLATETLLENAHVLAKIPHGAIVNMVRPNWDLTEVSGTHQNISHQGFLFWKGDVLYLRHASTLGNETVAELPFIDYLKRFKGHATLKGFHFMKMN